MRHYRLLREDQIEWAQFRTHGPFQTTGKGLSPAQRRGIIYERRVARALESRYLLRYFPSQWITYGDGAGTRWAQLDGLILLENPARAVITEVKLSHTADAYFQLTNLYRPLVTHLLRRSGRVVCTVEITKWYDCAVRFPCQVQLLSDLDAARGDCFGVNIFNRDG